MGKAAWLIKRVTGNKDCDRIYPFRANPGRPWGGIVPLSPVLAPGRRSGRVPALPYPPPRSPQFTLEHRDCANPSFSALARRRASRRQFLRSCGPDRLGPTGQLVSRRDIGDRVVQYRSPNSLTPSVMTHNFTPLQVTYADKIRLPVNQGGIVSLAILFV